MGAVCFSRVRPAVDVIKAVHTAGKTCSMVSHLDVLCCKGVHVHGFNSIARPLHRASAAICGSASGHASKMIGSTPMGAVCFSRVRPAAAKQYLMQLCR
jgi:hypothetical protein